MSTIPEWMIQKVQIQAQKVSDDIANTPIEGNKATLLNKWNSNLESWANQVNTTVEELVEAAGLSEFKNYLPPPSR